MKLKQTLILLSCIGVCLAGSISAEEPKTKVTGDKIQILGGGSKIVYSGNSKVVRGKNILKADKLVQDKGTEKVEASGNIDFVTYTETEEKILGRAGKGEFYLKSGKGKLWSNRPKLVYYVNTSSSPLELEADVINFNQEKGEIFAKGGVMVVSSSATAYAPQAQFWQKKKLMVMTGTDPQPRLIFKEEDKKGDFNADIITAYMDKKKILMENNVNGKVYLPD